MKNNSMLTMTFCQANDPNETYAWGTGIHDTYVLHYVLSGRGYFEVSGKKYSLKKGDSFIIFPGHIVNYYPDANDPWQYTWVNFTGSEVPLLLSMTAFYETPVCSDNTNLSELFSHFSRDFNYEHIHQRNDGLLRILLAHYIKVHPRQKKTFVTDKLSLAKSYVEANSHNHRFNVAELARGIGVERSYLYRLFVDGEGVSPSEYITNIRLKKSQQLMQTGVQQIKYVSYSAGFSDPLYFSKLFKKKYGISPKQYAKSIQEDLSTKNRD